MKALNPELPHKHCKPHILLVEDDQEDQILMKLAFDSTETDFSFHFVSNSKEAMDYMHERPDHLLPDLIVLDFHLPGHNGLKLMQQLNAHERYKGIEKVMLSTSSYSYLSKITEKEEFEHFTKPSCFNGLKQLARELLQLCQPKIQI